MGKTDGNKQDPAADFFVSLTAQKAGKIVDLKSAGELLESIASGEHPDPSGEAAKFLNGPGCQAIDLPGSLTCEEVVAMAEDSELSESGDVLSEAEQLDRIHEILQYSEWSADTPEAIASILHENGREIDELPENELVATPEETVGMRGDKRKGLIP